MENDAVTLFYQIEVNHSADRAVNFSKQFAQWESTPCPVNPKHEAHRRRKGQLHHFVEHNNRDCLVMAGLEWAIHKTVIQQFETEGFTGFRTKPAKVTFGDGKTSDEYREFIVTGWAGTVRPESGMHLIASCPGCMWKSYSSITDFDHVIDWTQWTGDDFFFVWPLVGQKLCTERIATWVHGNRCKDLIVSEGFELLKQRKRALEFGIPRGPLSDYLPEDLAIKYGRPLGLE